MADERAQREDASASSENAVESSDLLVKPGELENAISDQAPPIKRAQSEQLGTTEAERQFFGEGGLEGRAESEVTPEKMKEQVEGLTRELAESAEKQGNEFDASLQESADYLEKKAAESDVPVPPESLSALAKLRDQKDKLVLFVKGLFEKYRARAGSAAGSENKETPIAEQATEIRPQKRESGAETVVLEGNASTPESPVSETAEKELLIAEVQEESPEEQLGRLFGAELARYRTAFDLRRAEFDYELATLEERLKGKRIEGKVTLVDYLVHLNKRMADQGSNLPAEHKTALRDLLDDTRELFEKLQKTEALEARMEMLGELQAKELELKSAELGAELSWIQRQTVPEFNQRLSPDEMYAALKAGTEHPRFLLPVVLRQQSQLIRSGQSASFSKLLGENLPLGIRGGFEELLSDAIPAAQREEARKIAFQIRNGFYTEAASGATRLLEAMRQNPDAQIPFPLESLEATATVEAEQQALRYREARQNQIEFVDAMLERQDLSEAQREALEARRKTEEVFEKGELVSDLTNMKGERYDGKGPAIGVFEYNGQQRRGVVKFEFMDRHTRDGVTPGTGPLREVAATMAYVGMGIDAPAVVAKDLRFGEGEQKKEYGYSSITEVIDGVPASRNPEFFKKPGSENEVDDQMHLIAMVDHIIHRADGAPRNLMWQGETGKVIPIDFGSDLPSNTRERFSSVAMLAVSKLGETIPLHVQDAVRAWAESPAKDIFLKAVDTLPEDMGSYKERFASRLEGLLEHFERLKENATVVPYDEDSQWTDFGERVLMKIVTSSSKRSKTPSNQPLDKTQVFPKAV